jgi:hypothetical protein
MRSLICMGTSAILWSIWLCRNDVTFDKKKIILLFCRLFSGQLIGFVSGTSCKKECNRSPLKWARRTLETLAMEVFAKHGWSSFKRISARLLGFAFCELFHYDRSLKLQ